MSYLFTEIFPFLLGAGAVGALVGWMVRGSRQDEGSDALSRQHDALKQEHARCADVEMRLTALQATHARCVDAQSRIDDLQAKLGKVKRRYADYDVVKAENDALKSDRASGAVAALAVDVSGASAKRVAELEEQLANANSVRKEEAGVLEALRRSLDDAIAERDSLLLSVEQYEAQLSANARRFHELESDVEALQAAASQPTETAAPAAPAPPAAPTQTDGTPAGLLAERPDDADNLKRIKGVGPAIQRKLNTAGVYTFRQLAALGEAELVWLAEQVNTSASRISRDRWVEQASELAGGG